MISITSFVDLDEIAPVQFGKTYSLAPTAEHERPYHLLRQAMAQTKVGIASFVLRGKEYLAAVRAEAHVLALHTLRFADEIRDPADVVPETIDSATPNENELRTATAVIEAMRGKWRPEDYKDAYTAQGEHLLQDKVQGLQPEAAEAPHRRDCAMTRAIPPNVLLARPG